jgi:hypothetical protein
MGGGRWSLRPWAVGGGRWSLRPWAAESEGDVRGDVEMGESA